MRKEILELADGDEDAYIAVGEMLENGNQEIAKEIVLAIWEDLKIEYQLHDLALECLACYGTKYFQKLVDDNITKALFEENEDLLFCAIASYGSISKNLQKRYLTRLQELKTHHKESIRRAVKAELDWQTARRI